VTVIQDAFPPATAHTQAGDIDRAIVEDVHHRRGGELFGLARHLGLTDEEANDAAQEALLRLWTAIDAGKVIDQPDAWTFRTLYRICMDQHRWRRRVRALAERLGPNRESHDSDRTDLIAVWSAVERLPERQRLAIYLRYRADLPFEEIAAILGIQAVSARSHVSRALETLRESFADERELIA
jgi:RNA polymerase sigma-70 factor (ECF subfamily)